MENSRRTSGPVALLVLIGRLGLGGLLLATALAKLLDNRGFAGVVGSYALLPEPLWLSVGLLVGLTELILGLWLLTGRRLALAAATAFALHCAYLALLGSALVRGLELDNCGCFGVYWPRPLGPMSLIEDLFLAGIALALWTTARKAQGPSPGSSAQ